MKPHVYLPISYLNFALVALRLAPIGHSSNNCLHGIQTEVVDKIRSMQGIHYEDDGGLSSNSDGSDDKVDFIDALDIIAVPSASRELLLDIHI